ncbi:hypothetical protein J6590_026661 [Homalodisca vitripennis]|nr:hypothetical protein J6590_026661 [Homalodisca vitripennis]
MVFFAQLHTDISKDLTNEIRNWFLKCVGGLITSDPGDDDRPVCRQRRLYYDREVFTPVVSSVKEPVICDP